MQSQVGLRQLLENKKSNLNFSETIPPVEWIPCTDATAEVHAHRAVVAGYEGHDGSPLWVIRAHHEGDLIPGKLAIKHKSAYVPWGGQEIRVHNIEVSIKYYSSLILTK